MMHSVWIGSNRTELYTKIIKKFGKISGMVRCEKIELASSTEFASVQFEI